MLIGRIDWYVCFIVSGIKGNNKSIENRATEDSIPRLIADDSFKEDLFRCSIILEEVIVVRVERLQAKSF